ncbi:MAG: hypothetical protein ACXV95_12685 [Acidimicrobiales bacterium]
MADRRPPELVVRLLNPVMRFALRSPFGRALGALAELEFEGRRSGHRRRIVVAWHEQDGAALVFSPAPWRANFAGGRAATVWHRGRPRPWSGTLVADRSAVVDLVNRVLATGASAGSIGLRIAPGHELDADDIAAVDRAAIRFEPR